MKKAGLIGGAFIFVRFPAISRHRWRRSAKICARRGLGAATIWRTVSKVLKIRKDHLEALEEDRMEALPDAPTRSASLVRMRIILGWTRSNASNA